MKVFVTDIYENRIAARFAASDAKALLCNQVKGKAPQGIRVFDANSERISGTWEVWSKNQVVVEGLLDKAPALRYVNGLDLKPAMLKTALWANRKFGYLKSWLSKHPDVQPVSPVDLYPCNPWKVRFKYLKLKVSNGMAKPVHRNEVPESAIYALLADDMFEFNILLPVARILGKDKVCWVRTPSNRFKQHEISLIKKDWICWAAPAAPKKFLPWIPLMRMNRQELFCLNAWINDLTPISDSLHWGASLFKSSIQVLVTLAQENTHVGHILCAQAKKYGKHTVNTMNGIKFADAISSGASFDAWIVWDEAMKKLLHEQVHIPEQQLRVAGSLQQDALADSVYLHTLPLSDDEIKNKRIISVASCKDLRLDKLESLETLYRWAEENPDCIILYRPHPAETEKNLFLPQNPSFRFELISPDAASHKQSLKDQLIVSDLMISFGSTVSIEAMWMGTPGITYEKKPVSNLYCVDGKNLLHLTEKEALLDVLNRLEKKKPRPWSNAGPDAVSTAYADIIRSYASGNAQTPLS